MKAVYLGSVRGYQSAVYRPGTGWSSADIHRHVGRQPAVLKQKQLIRLCPLTVAKRRRPGLKTRIAILAILVSVAALLAIVLSGAAQL